MRKRKIKQQIELRALPKNTWCPFPTTKREYKIYKDGNHFVGTICVPYHNKKPSLRFGLSKEQRYFDEQYVSAVKQGISKSSMCSFLCAKMREEYPEMKDIKDFVNENISRKWHNHYARLKRFKRKANLNLWNKFVTITYDDKKMDEDTFRRKLRKCLSNLHCRHNWRYMGVFERGEDNNRLHFHALMYIPENQMIGTIVEKKDYSTKQHKMQTTHSNTFFFETFGRNDFDELNRNEITNGKAIEYITKYIQKSGEKIVYSRGIPSEIVKEIDDKDIATELIDFGVKYVFFDDIIDTEIDIMKFKRQQANIFDYINQMSG